MFSYLRPHRRTPSTPSSPAPDQSHSWEGPTHPAFDHAHPQRYQDGTPSEPSAKTAPPSILPPIARVSSTGDVTSVEFSSGASTVGQYNQDHRAPDMEASRGDIIIRDINTFDNHSRIPAEELRQGFIGNGRSMNYTNSADTPPHVGMNDELPLRQKPSGTQQPVSFTPDAPNRLIESGRRPTDARLPTPPSRLNPVLTSEPAQSRSGKRLNLLNPMSLLARRRTSQAVTQLSADTVNSSRPGNAFNESFDPRIKGTVVHDFSAPRPPPRKIVSTNDIRTEENAQSGHKTYQRSPNPQSRDASASENVLWVGGNHTPVFTENFEEEQYPAAGPHVRKTSDLSDLPLPEPPYAKGAQKPLGSDSASKSNDKQYLAARKISARRPILDVPPPVPPKGEGQSGAKGISIDLSSTPPRSFSSSRKGRARNVSEVSAKDALPKHMKSTSSRFSFDMIGAVEQERVLEDRHRQKALENRHEGPSGNAQDYYEEDYDYDNMMDDDGLEEPIPMVHDDYDEEDPNLHLEREIPGANVDPPDEGEDILDDSENIAGLSFQQSSASPLSPHISGMISTPRDANGDAIGFAVTKNSPYPSTGNTRYNGVLLGPSASPEAELQRKDQIIQGLGLQGIDTSLRQLPQKSTLSDSEETNLPQPSSIDHDDLYFDDGMIDELAEVDDGVEFDESVFDNVDTDEYGRPLKSFASLPTLYSPPNFTKVSSPSFDKITENNESDLRISQIRETTISPGTVQSSGSLAPQPLIAENDISRTSLPIPGLTQDTLAAYQEALATAAFNAAANGKFRRDSSPPNPTPSEQDLQPDLVPDSSHTSRYEPFSPSFEDEFDYDDALEDDPIIAAANAEALAYDTDGFYGQEFGFYSAPAVGEAQYVNGGYFGPRGAEGVSRSQSGRIISREPNLTPITERSEYSNRNSIMSTSMYGHGSITSPGLAQLAGLMSHPDYEEDLSLNALLKLRRGAWGGSQASLHSSTGSPRSAGGADDSSPVGLLPPWQEEGGVKFPTGGHKRVNSTFSLVSDGASDVGSGLQSEQHSAPASPTLTMSLATAGELPKYGSCSQGVKEGGVVTNRHRHTRSADSFSYLKEEDPQSPTGERWVLERRRTSELGEEILAREIVSGGRI